MTIFYLPVESSARELTGKIFLATRLAAEGHQAVIFRSDFFDRTGWPLPGIYIGKNCFRTERPHGLEFYTQMKKAGIDVWYLDEEGGICPGNDLESWNRSVLRRMDTAVLDENDKLLVWGNWQAKAFRSEDSAVDITVTGNPNFDVLQPKYSPFFNDYDRGQTGGLDNFVLINTRFALSNGLIDIAGHLSTNRPGMRMESTSEIAKLIASSGIFQFMFTRLVQELAQRFPQETFVLRPHPVEKERFYNLMFSELPNVVVSKEGDVGSWIRRCRLLIQNGSTTAIQASVAQKPVITYIPIDDNEKVVPGLPNLVGRICHTVDQVADALNAPFHDKAAPVWEETISELDTIEKIHSIFIACDRQFTEPSKDELRNHLITKARRFNLSEVVRRPVRLLSAEKMANARLCSDAFKPEFFSNAPSLHEAASGFYNTTTQIEQFGEIAYLIH